MLFGVGNKKKDEEKQRLIQQELRDNATVLRCISNEVYTSCKKIHQHIEDFSKSPGYGFALLHNSQFGNQTTNDYLIKIWEATLEAYCLFEQYINLSSLIIDNYNTVSERINKFRSLGNKINKALLFQSKINTFANPSTMWEIEHKIECTPFDHELYWNRLMKTNCCSNSIDLILNGVVLSKTPDFQIALKLAPPQIKNTYEIIDQYAQTLCTEYSNALILSEYEQYIQILSNSPQKIDKSVLSSLKKQTSTFKTKIVTKYNKIIEDINKLLDAENNLRFFISNSLMLLENDKKRINSYTQSSNTFNISVKNLVELSSQDCDDFETELKKYIKICEISKDRAISRRPEQFKELSRNIQMIKTDISKKINDLTIITQELKAMINDIKDTKQKFDKYRILAETTSYSSVFHVIEEHAKEIKEFYFQED